MQLSLSLKTGLIVSSMLITLMPTSDAAGLRSYADRIRAVDIERSDILGNMLAGNSAVLNQLEAQNEQIEGEEDEVISMLELMQALANADVMSMGPTPAPSVPGFEPSTVAPSVSGAPSSEPTVAPSVSSAPSFEPTAARSVSGAPSFEPTIAPSVSAAPSSEPTVAPSVSSAPSSEPTIEPSDFSAPSFGPSVTPSVSSAPSSGPTVSPSVSSAPSFGPTLSPTLSPTISPRASPSAAPTISPMTSPTSFPTAGPVLLPSQEPSEMPTSESTLVCGIPPEERSSLIMGVLETVADPSDLRDPTTIQGQAAAWLIGQDELLVCPDDEKLIQRFALAVIYFATNGDSWFKCSANPVATDACGMEDPFKPGASRFLSGENECQWAGISCDSQLCVDEIEFELNNLVGTIPTEIALLTGLKLWGMEQGGLTGPIPTEVGLLQELIFIDLDFNQLTGSLSSELLSLRKLTQFDINDNRLTGSIEVIGGFSSMTFMQFHNNFFTGTVPEAVGMYANLTTFTLHETAVSGTMPDSVCRLLPTANLGGNLTSLIADCGGLDPDIVCDCCTSCRV